jgi:hypothetical protein
MSINSRRNFLSMMAALPLVSAANSLTGSKRHAPENGNFYVWVHGVFGISWIAPTQNNSEASIELFCPWLNEEGNRHRYFVGRIIKADRPVDPGYLPCGLKEIVCTEYPAPSTVQSNFKFYGLPSSGTENPTGADCDGFPYLHGSLAQPFSGYRFCLPNPTRILPLRGFRVRCKPSRGSHFPRNPFVMPMCHVLVYENVDPHAVRVQRTDDNSWLWTGANSQHLHLFVEPVPVDKSGNGHDADASLKALLSSYCVAYFDLVAKERCPRLDNVSDFCDDLEEQMFIYEWCDVNICGMQAVARVRETFKPQGCPQFLFIPQ